MNHVVTLTLSVRYVLLHIKGFCLQMWLELLCSVFWSLQRWSLKDYVLDIFNLVPASVARYWLLWMCTASPIAWDIARKSDGFDKSSDRCMCLAQLCQLNFTIWSRLVFKRRDMILDAIRWQPMLANSLSGDWKRRLGSWCYLERVRVMVTADAVEYGQVSWFLLRL